MAGPNQPQNQPLTDAELMQQEADDLIDRGKRMLEAIKAAGLDPLADARNLVVLQLLGPITMRIVGQDPRAGQAQIIEIAEQFSLEYFIPR